MAHSDSLTLVWHVQDDAHWLARGVAATLEALSDADVTHELLLVDDGSSESVYDLCRDLSRTYAQTSLLAHGRCRGPAAVQRTGWQRAGGRWIAYRAAGASCGGADAARVVQALRRHAFVALANTPLVEIGPGGSRSPAACPPELFAADRRLADAWLHDGADAELFTFLTARGYSPHWVAPRSPQAMLTQGGWMADRPATAWGSPASTARLPAATSRAEALKRPNYLDRLRAFAWGE